MARQPSRKTSASTEPAGPSAAGPSGAPPAGPPRDRIVDALMTLAAERDWEEIEIRHIAEYGPTGQPRYKIPQSAIDEYLQRHMVARTA